MGATELKIRPLELKDLEEVLLIEECSFRPPWSRSTFLSELEEENRYYVVAEEGGKIVGYAGIYYFFEDGYITTMAVAPAWRRKGIGKRLLYHQIEKAKELGLKKLWLEVRESNRVAQEMYRKFGFKMVARRRKYYVQPLEDAIIMCLKLTGGLFNLRSDK